MCDMSVLGIVIAVLGLGLLAAAHEIGHFIVARMLGIKVEELSVFIGPSLFSWKRKGVEYHIRLIPFGAYVRFPGMEEDDNGLLNPDSLINQARWKRLLVSLAGPTVNFLLGILIFALVFSYYGFTSTKLGVIAAGTQMAATEAKSGDEITRIDGQQIFTDLDIGYMWSKISDDRPLVMSLKSAQTGKEYQVTLNPEYSVQYRIGITVESELSKEGGMKVVDVDKDQNGGNPLVQKDDIVMALNGIPVKDPGYADIRDKDAETITLTVLRDGKTIEHTIKAVTYQSANERGIRITMGSGFGDLIKESVLYSVSVIHVSIESLKDMVKGDVEVTDVVSGPVGIVSVVSQVVDAPQVDDQVKLYNLGLMAGLISVGLAFSNMLPLPGLDGNSIVMVTVELIRGRKISLKTERVINVIGFTVLIMLVVFALYSDITRLVG